MTLYSDNLATGSLHMKRLFVIVIPASLDLVIYAFNDKKREGESPYRQFLIVRPQITDDQCHPEEGLFETVTEDMWRTHMNEPGQIEDVFQLRKVRPFSLTVKSNWPVF